MLYSTKDERDKHLPLDLHGVTSRIPIKAAGKQVASSFKILYFSRRFITSILLHISTYIQRASVDSANCQEIQLVIPADLRMLKV